MNAKAKTYPLSDRLKIAIEKIFEEPETGFISLGVGGFPLAAREEFEDTDVNYKNRVNMLKEKFEYWIQIYASETEEFDNEHDTIRLESEARAILMVLREIHAHFSEVF